MISNLLSHNPYEFSVPVTPLFCPILISIGTSRNFSFLVSVYKLVLALGHRRWAIGAGPRTLSQSPTHRRWAIGFMRWAIGQIITSFIAGTVLQIFHVDDI